MISKINEELINKEKEFNEIQNFTEKAKDKANILVSEMSSLKEDKEKLQFQAKVFLIRIYLHRKHKRLSDFKTLYKY